jgi:hypothetical protein
VLFPEHKVKPDRATDATRFPMAPLARPFDRSSALVVVKPATKIRWHRKGLRLFRRWRSKPRGPLKLPAHLLELIREVTANSPICKARFDDELLLELGIWVAPRTVGRICPTDSTLDTSLSLRKFLRVALRERLFCAMVHRIAALPATG